MGKVSSDEMNSGALETSGPRGPQVFVLSSDLRHLKSVFSQCRDVPEHYSMLPGVAQLMERLRSAPKLDLIFALIVEKTAAPVDALALRTCKLEFPEIYFIVVLDECEQQSYVRFQSLGVQSVLLPPYSELSLKAEIATALPNLPQFKRHPDLANRGSVHMDFLIPSDLAYVLGINRMVSLLLKEFGFPPADYRINIPLACDEAITNAIIHGNGNDAAKKVAVQVYVSASRFKLRVKDQGPGFEAGGLADPTEGSNLLRSSGRGVYLMRSIMDSVQYKEGGRVLELEKANTSANGRSNHNNNHKR